MFLLYEGAGLVIRAANDAYLSRVDRPIIGMPAREVFPELEWFEAQEMFSRVMASGHPESMQVMGWDGLGILTAQALRVRGRRYVVSSFRLMPVSAPSPTLAPRDRRPAPAPRSER
jgi:hypothetical protein